MFIINVKWGENFVGFCLKKKNWVSFKTSTIKIAMLSSNVTGFIEI